MKSIGTKFENQCGIITVSFADRCKEYQDAGVPLTPTCHRTIRVEGYLDLAPPVTNQIAWVKGNYIYEGKKVYMEVNEIFILN
jgi:hypothetical protein